MCMIDGCDEYAEVSSQKIVVARKQHTCCECGRKISPGERYRYAFQIYERSPYQYHTCEHCQVAQSWLTRECGGYLIHGTWEDIAEHAREYPALRFPLGRLLVGARRKWVGMSVPAVPTATVHDYVR